MHKNKKEPSKVSTPGSYHGKLGKEEPIKSKAGRQSRVRQCAPVIPAHSREKKEDHAWEPSLGYMTVVG